METYKYTSIIRSNFSNNFASSGGALYFLKKYFFFFFNSIFFLNYFSLLLALKIFEKMYKFFFGRSRIIQFFFFLKEFFIRFGFNIDCTKIQIFFSFI